MDVKAALNGNVTIYPQTRKLIPTGLHVAIPAGHYIQVVPRSGLALKHGIAVLNSPGVIDEGFRGEIGVILINHGDQPFVIEPGDRIAQLVLSKFETIEWQVVEELPESERGQKGFGSSGK